MEGNITYNRQLLPSQRGPDSTNSCASIRNDLTSSTGFLTWLFSRKFPIKWLITSASRLGSVEPVLPLSPLEPIPLLSDGPKTSAIGISSDSFKWGAASEKIGHLSTDSRNISDAR